ncbi:hypothetical protein GYMLUDRAFT_1018027, partial [Collybiopsis luxurians FD-317 M1]
MASSSRSLIYPSSSFSVAQQLPFDVLSEIFQYLPDLHLIDDLEAEVVSPKTGPYILHPDRYPWSLTKICRIWRHAALYEPRLWSRVHLEVGMRPIPQGKVDLLQTYLSRSRQSLLVVSIHCTYVGRVRENPLLNMLFPTSNRWKFFSLHVLDKSIPLFTPLAGSFLSLETLHLYIAHQAKTPPLTKANKIFEYAPRLHTVRFRHSEDRSIFWMPYDNQQIQVYQGPISSIPHEQGCQWMENLRWCAIAANVPRLDWKFVEVTAPLMKEFSIQDRIQPFNSAAIMDSMTFPNLEVLRVKAAGPVHLCQAISGLLDRSLCAATLTEVCLDIPDLTTPLMEAVLEQMPYIVKFRMTSRKLLPDFVNRWKYDPKTHMDNPCLLQCLEHLDLGRCTFTPQAELELLEFVQSRWEVPEKGTPEKYFAGPTNHSVTRLKSFGVPYKYQRTKRSHKKILKVWRAEGLTIVFGPGSQNRL